MTPIEGWIAGWHGIYWKISGYMHPETGLVAVPYRGKNRLEPTTDIPWQPKHYISCIGRKVYTIPRHANLINPYRVLKLRLNDLKDKRPGIVDLLDVLSPEWAGLTGSWAVWSESESSDVDLLVYGKDVYKTLIDLQREGRIRWCPGKHNLRLPRLHGIQLLDACYLGNKYTIRILKTLDEMECNGYIRIPIAALTSPAEINPVRPYTVPATYIIHLEGVGRAVMETWHTRYQELAPGRYIVKYTLFYEIPGDRLIASPDLGGWIARVDDHNKNRLGGISNRVALAPRPHTSDT